MMGLPKFPPKLSDINPVKRIANALRGGIEGIESAARELESAARDIGGTAPRQPARQKPTEGSITDEETLRYQLDKLLSEVRQLEIHLSEGCRIEDRACDCCLKHPRDIRFFAKETISIAARMGLDTGIFRELAEWARRIETISSVKQIESGEFESTYPQESGVASKFRKELEAMRAEVKPKSFTETCQKCGALENLKQWRERKSGRED